MAVTRLSDGVCVACLDEQNHWVRPTREKRRNWRQLELADLRDDAGREVVMVGNVVEWDLEGPAPARGVHTEDAFVARRRPRLIERLPAAQFLVRCAAVCDSDLRAFLCSPNRSLTLLQPERIRCIELTDAGKVPGSPGFSARIYFVHQRIIDDFGVTDLQWRALGRSLLEQRGVRRLALSQEALEYNLSRPIRYLAVGRGQPWEEKRHRLAGVYWPFFISVITDPPLEQAIDWHNL